ncbi:hypothetical protein WR25_10347 [Diploscapter pachys]|uniref:Uncharacterized protein n=1 Tax=Diploscapter pachys TaxID=2018661 RepID=A0A2A2K007_9BILA|nr:hypothetical protein WR25_10347 [Diploscapter pachys]
MSRALSLFEIAVWYSPDRCAAQPNTNTSGALANTVATTSPRVRPNARNCHALALDCASSAAKLICSPDVANTIAAFCG